MYEWMDGWMDGCMYVCMYVCERLHTYMVEDSIIPNTFLMC